MCLCIHVCIYVCVPIQYFFKCKTEKTQVKNALICTVIIYWETMKCTTLSITFLNVEFCFSIIFLTWEDFIKECVDPLTRSGPNMFLDLCYKTISSHVSQYGRT